MTEIKLDPTTCRLLLFIRYCGDKNSDTYLFEGKKLFVKWYFLARNPKLLVELFQLKNISYEVVVNNKMTEKYFRFKFGVYIKKFNDLLAKPIYLGLLKIKQAGNKQIFVLTKPSINIIEKCKQISEMNKFIKILIEIKLNKSKFSNSEIYNFTDKKIRKYEKKLGTLIKEEDFDF